MPTNGRIIQISVSPGGVPKHPVTQAQVAYDGLEGDQQGTPKIHGGPLRAVCLWAEEVIAALQAEGHPIAPGRAGENITVAGLPWANVAPGAHLTLGDALQLQITDYAAPCRKNMRWFKDRRYSRISQKHYPGSSRVYAQVLREGLVRVGDRVELVE